MNNSISIDSLKLRIPMSDVTVIDESVFGSKYIVDALSGNVDKEYKQNRHLVAYHGIKTSFGIEHQVTEGQKVKEYLVILFNSKLLQEHYFDGITLETVEAAYFRIMAMKVADFTYQSFLNAECTDVDFKQDLEQSNFSKTLNYINSHAKLSKKIGEGSNKFDKHTNKGIEFGRRETATPSYPFLKFYHKGLELLNSSVMFYDTHLSGLGLDLTNLIRVETTVKNKKHFRNLGVHNTSLNSILKLSQEKLSEILTKAINRHLEKRLVIITTTKDLKPMDRVHFNSMSLLISQGANYNLVREMLLQGLGDKTARHRARKTLDRIYNENIKGSEGDEIANELSSFCNAVGWV